jgi:hypothetical protein
MSLTPEEQDLERARPESKYTDMFLDLNQSVQGFQLNSNGPTTPGWKGIPTHRWRPRHGRPKGEFQPTSTITTAVTQIPGQFRQDSSKSAQN